MRRKQFSEDQIVRILEEFERGKSLEELCREYNVARSTIYMWRKKYGGIDKPMLKKLKELEVGQVLEILADDEGIKEDMPAWCKTTGNEFLGLEEEGGEYKVYIKKSK